MALHADFEVRVLKIKCGSQGNNSYIVVDSETGKE